MYFGGQTQMVVRPITKLSERLIADQLGHSDVSMTARAASIGAAVSHPAGRLEISRTAAPVSPNLMWQQPSRPPAPRTCVGSSVKPDPTAPRTRTYLAVDREAARPEAGDLRLISP